MPGLVDAHTHVALHPGDYESQILRETPEFRAIWSTVNARKTLEAGITTVRDVGSEGPGFVDIALRDAIAKGLVEGPTQCKAEGGRRKCDDELILSPSAFRLPPYIEIERMVSYGMRPIDALRAATFTSASLLGIADIAGTVEPGQSADLVAFDGNPLTDITALERPVFVMREGRVIVQRVPE